MECINERIIECIEHDGAFLQEDFHYKCQVKVSKKIPQRAPIYNSRVHQKQEN